jgi:hypothetical protein
MLVSQYTVSLPQKAKTVSGPLHHILAMRDLILLLSDQSLFCTGLIESYHKNTLSAP